MAESSLMTLAMVAAILFFASVGVLLLTRPSLYARWFPNALMPPTPWNRIQMRGLGLVLCVFLVLVCSGVFSTNVKPGVLKGFHKNVLIALWACFFLTPIFCLVVWKTSVWLVRRGYVNGTFDDDAWERAVSIAFCSMLVVIVGLAWAFRS